MFDHDQNLTRRPLLYALQLTNTKNPTSSALRQKLYDVSPCSLKRQPFEMHFLEVREHRLQQNLIYLAPFQSISQVIGIVEVQIENYILQAWKGSAQQGLRDPLTFFVNDFDHEFNRA